METKIVWERSFYRFGEDRYIGYRVDKIFKTYNFLLRGEDTVSKSRLRIRFNLKPVFDIQFLKGKNVKLFFLSYLKPSLICEIEKDKYEIFQHKGYLTSFFLNGHQIGYVKTKSIIRFGNNFEAIFVHNKNIDIEVVYTLILNTCLSFNDEQVLTFDMGNLVEGRKFDNTWRPID
jgi:hypothetical protein